MTPEMAVLASGAVTFRPWSEFYWTATLTLGPEAVAHLAGGPVPGWAWATVQGAPAWGIAAACQELMHSVHLEVQAAARSRP